MSEYRERDRRIREERERSQIGTKAHLRKREQEHTQAQKRAADTCNVTLYDNGNLRVERRGDGFAWAGKSCKTELVGHSSYTDEHGVFHPDTRELVNIGPKGTRGACRGAVASCMARMRDKLNMVSKDVLPVFITLTWPLSQQPDAEGAKRCLDTFIKRLRRKYHRASGFWKMEFGEQSHGLHFHILLWGAKPWKDWVSDTWYKVCGTNNPKHRAAGTRIEAIRSYRGVLSYSSKNYMGKTGEAPPGNWGRVWGIFNKACIPWAGSQTVEAPGRVGVWFSRIQRRFMRAKYGKRNGGRGRVLWVNCEHTAQWLRVLEWAERMPTPERVGLAECPF